MGADKQYHANVEEHQRTFEGLIKFFAWVFGISALILIFLAIVGT